MLIFASFIPPWCLIAASPQPWRRLLSEIHPLYWSKCNSNYTHDDLWSLFGCCSFQQVFYFPIWNLSDGEGRHGGADVDSLRWTTVSFWLLLDFHEYHFKTLICLCRFSSVMTHILTTQLSKCDILQCKGWIYSSRFNKYMIFKFMGIKRLRFTVNLNPQSSWFFLVYVFVIRSRFILSLTFCSASFQETLMTQLLWAPRCSPPPLHKYHLHSRRRRPLHRHRPPSTPASWLTG